jgi:hypothetical protein
MKTHRILDPVGTGGKINAAAKAGAVGEKAETVQTIV